jgi:hypothetical protein
MQLLLAAQTFCPGGQLHEPPGPLHVWPTTVQSAVVQQLACGMQLDEPAHSLKPERQLQLVPGLGQISPAIDAQSASVQQVVLMMQPPTIWHTTSPTGHTHWPMLSHICPVYGQASGG